MQDSYIRFVPKQNGILIFGFLFGLGSLGLLTVVVVFHGVWGEL